MKYLKRIAISALTLLLLVTSFYFTGPTTQAPTYDLSFPSIQTPLATINDSLAKFDAQAGAEPCALSTVDWFDSIVPTEYVLLYLHGFSASQHEGDSVRYWVADHLKANAFYPRIAGHGLIEPDSLRYATYTATEAWEKAKKDFALATTLGHKVIIMSCSTGTPLAIKLAATFPDKVHALVNYSPNIRLHDPLASLTNGPWGLDLLKWISGQEYRDLAPREDGVTEDCKHRSYSWESVIEMQWLLETTMTVETFKAVRAPSLTMMWNESVEVRDKVVSVEKAQWMHANLSSPLKQWANCACKDHVIHNYQTSSEAVNVYETTLAFLNNCSTHAL